MLQYMKAFLAEEERRKQQGLPSQVPASTTDDHAAAVTTEEESSDEEQPAKKIGRFAAIDTADEVLLYSCLCYRAGLRCSPPCLGLCKVHDLFWHPASD